MNALALPADRTDTATFLRDLEQNCPRTTPLDVKAALIRAAKELEDWKRLAEDAANQLEEASRIQISQMASHSRVDEIQRQVKLTLVNLAKTFRERA